MDDRMDIELKPHSILEGDFISVLQGRFAGDLFELPIEIRHVVKTTFVAYLGNVLVILHQQLAGITYSNFIEKL